MHCLISIGFYKERVGLGKLVDYLAVIAKTHRQHVEDGLFPAVFFVGEFQILASICSSERTNEPVLAS